MKFKSINGLTDTTHKYFLLDAGAFFKNFDPATDTIETAKKTKLLGATKGGGSFKAIPTFRKIEIDGMRGKVKGTEQIESWEVSISAKVIEVTKENLKMALIGSEEGASNPSNYMKIKGKQYIEDADYLDNITWAGTISGSDKPVYIRVFNALSQKGLELGIEDKNEGVIELEFNGFYSGNDMDTPPFEILYPTIE